MFDLFKKTEPDAAKIDGFCDWFAANSERIIASMENRENDRETMFKTLDEVEEQLAMVYRDGYRGEIQFEYGFNAAIGKWELNLFHLNKRFLVRAASSIAEKINRQLGDTWTVNIGQ